MMETSAGIPVDAAFVSGYFSSLVNRIYKILPIRERSESTLGVYLDSLMLELLGCEQLLTEIRGDPVLLTLLSTVRYLRDNPDLPVAVVRREVFRCISVCKKTAERYGGEDA